MKTEVPPKNVILSEFIKDQYKSTLSGKLEIISKSNDLIELLGFYRSYPNNEDQKTIVQATASRIDKIGQRLISKEGDVIKLVRFYTEYCGWHGYYKLSQIVFKRIQSLFNQVKDLEELFLLRKKMSEKYIGEDQYCLYHAIEDRMIEIASNHPSRCSFPFLLNIVLHMGKGLPACEKLAALVPEALITENDIKVLGEYYEQSYNGWNGHRNGFSKAVMERIKEVLIASIPITSDISILSNYMYWARSFEDSIQIQADKRMGKVLKAKLVELPEIEEVVKYYNSIYLGNWKFTSEIRKSFRERMLQIVDSVIAKVNDAMEAYKLWELLEYKQSQFRCTLPDFYDSAKLIREKFQKLVPDYFKSNQSFGLAWEWHFLCNNELEGWSGIFSDQIKGEGDLDELVQVREDYRLPEEFKKKIEQRIGTIVSNLRKPNKFFIDSIKNKEFYGNKEIFIKKAMEFSN